jgi:hypothetical protein
MAGLCGRIGRDAKCFGQLKTLINPGASQMTVDRFPGITLRVVNSQRPISESVRELKLQLLFAWDKGESWPTPGAPDRRRRYSYRAYDVPLQSAETFEIDLLAFLRSARRQRRLFGRLRRAGSRFTIYCAWAAGSPRGFTLEAESVKIMASLEFALAVECYP